MIPAAYITDWERRAPWPTREQIEQDLVLSRLIVELANDGYLGEELVFRGGTCLHKLYLPTPLRYSRRHCSLCEITHGSVRQRPKWRACQAELPVRFDTYHRDDQPDPIRTAAGGQAPVVVAETDLGHMLLLASADLDACDGSIDRLVEAIERSAVRLGLTWAAP